MQKQYHVGIYARLSRDDNNQNLESMSIANQKQILMDYVKQKGWELIETYVDDGFTGTNFDRPDFKRMLRDIEHGLIDCVITKDLSRLGRNYSMTGYYTDEYFPEQNVRYIAINDGVDTMGQNNDFAAFHNVINEYYPRDISRKVRQVKKVHATKGMYIGSFAPYGYQKDPADKHKLVVDEEAAKVVRRIFAEIANGTNSRRLAAQLNDEGLICPRAYRYQRLGKENPKDESTLWGSSTVLSILKNTVYLGHMVQGKRQTVSFKSKKRRVTKPDEWFVVKNTHKPIVSQELWDEAHRVKYKAVRCNKPKLDREISIFAGLTRCADCGGGLSASPKGRKGERKMTYCCSTYCNKGKTACSSHWIREEVLEAVVLNDIRTFAYLAQKDRDALVKDVASKISENTKSDTDTAEAKLLAMRSKLHEITATVKNLYKDKMEGKMPDSFFYSLLDDYDKEKQELEKNIPVLEEQLQADQRCLHDANRFADEISKFLKLEKIDRAIARALIEKIVVSDSYKVDGVTMKNITIHYRFVGNLSCVQNDALSKRKIAQGNEAS